LLRSCGFFKEVKNYSIHPGEHFLLAKTQLLVYFSTRRSERTVWGCFLAYFFIFESQTENFISSMEKCPLGFEMACSCASAGRGWEPEAIASCCGS